MKIQFYGILLFILVFALSGYAQNNTQLPLDSHLPAKENAIKQIIKRGYIVIGMVEKDQPPFFYVNENGKLSGFDVDLAEGIAKALDVNVVYDRSSKSFNDLIPLVESRKADLIISKLSRTLERAKKVRFSKPYLQLRQALLFNQLRLAKYANTDKEIVKLIKNYNIDIGVIANSSYVTFAKNNFKQAQINSFPSWNDAIESLFNGDTSAIYRDELEIKKVIQIYQKSLLEIKTVILNDTRDTIAIAINADYPMLQEWVNIYLQENLPAGLDIDYLLENYKIQ